MLHLVPPIKRKKGKGFILGRVVYKKENPYEYSVKVIKPKTFKVMVGDKGVYIADDDTAEEIIARAFERYLRETYGKRRPRTQKEVVEAPVEVKEEELREFFREKGAITSYKSCAFLAEGLKSRENDLRALLKA